MIWDFVRVMKGLLMFNVCVVISGASIGGKVLFLNWFCQEIAFIAAILAIIVVVSSAGIYVLVVRTRRI